MSTTMEMNDALPVLSAIAQPTRLAIHRLLMETGPEGLAVSAIAERAAIPQNLVSSHLLVLSKAGLVIGERRGKSVIYRARRDVLDDLAAFLIGRAS